MFWKIYWCIIVCSCFLLLWCSQNNHDWMGKQDDVIISAQFISWENQIVVTGTTVSWTEAKIKKEQWSGVIDIWTYVVNIPWYTITSIELSSTWLFLPDDMVIEERASLMKIKNPYVYAAWIKSNNWMPFFIQVSSTESLADINAYCAKRWKVKDEYAALQQLWWDYICNKERGQAMPSYNEYSLEMFQKQQEAIRNETWLNMVSRGDSVFVTGDGVNYLMKPCDFHEGDGCHRTMITFVDEYRLEIVLPTVFALDKITTQWCFSWSYTYEDRNRYMTWIVIAGWSHGPRNDNNRPCIYMLSWDASLGELKPMPDLLGMSVVKK